MIELKNVSFSYDKNIPVLKDISLTINDGQSIGLIGANGAGKSTLMKLLLGLLFPTEGHIYVDGEAISKENLYYIRKKLGFVLQNSDNQMFMPTVYEDMIFGPLNYSISREDVEKQVDEVLAQLGQEKLKYRYNHKMSGGEKRMAAIATVLTMEPDVIIMDEPTSALDPYNRRIIINTICALKKTKIITSHDLDMIWDTCTRIILLSDGIIVADGDAASILQNKALLEENRMELPLSLTPRI